MIGTGSLIPNELIEFRALVVVAIALTPLVSGCSSHTVENDLHACTAEGLKAHVADEKMPIFERACMGGKGYEYRLTDNGCVKVIETPINLADCFVSRSLWADIRRAVETSE